MCGIVGVISQKPIDMLFVQKMNNKLFHRGPDGYGYLSSQNNLNLKKLDHIDTTDLGEDIHLALGHRRLAIHDLSAAGHQPMLYLDRYWVVFNGEVYNFVELRSELEKAGYVFKSHTDTEVIMAAYDYWGAQCLDKFNGMWAFILVDTITQKVFMARDRFGVKPLYYFMKDGLFVFASEIKAILEYVGVEKAPNIQYLQEYLKSGPKEYIKETAFQDIYRFDFAHYFEGNLSDLLDPKRIKLKRYWDIKPNLSHESIEQKKLEEYAKKYYDLLRDAVKIRLRSDVKVGSALSGGLDSSSIVYLVNSLHKEEGVVDKQETFSSIYKSPGTTDCDESIFINQVAEMLNVKSNQIEAKVENVQEEHRKMIYHMENPPDSTLMSSWHTFKLVGASDVTVTLDGQGADEELAGYLFYLIYYFANLPIKDIFKAYRGFRTIPLSGRYVFLGMMANFSKRIIGKKMTQFFYELSGRKEPLFTDPNAKLVKDFTSSLVTLLHYADSTSMAYSIESRMPFMDYRVVEFLAAIPISYKLHEGWTKYLARIAMQGCLPDSIIWRKDKIGWAIPEKSWFSTTLAKWLEDKVTQSSFLKKTGLEAMYKEDMRLSDKLRLLNITIWYEVFFEEYNP